MKALSDEYTRRNLSDHPLKDGIEKIYFGTRPRHVTNGALSSFPLDLPDKFREVKFPNGEIHMLDYVPIKDAVVMYRDFVQTNEIILEA